MHIPENWPHQARWQDRIYQAGSYYLYVMWPYFVMIKAGHHSNMAVT
jgi:hypothetical protein